jgi:demethylmenaquinone methyltransferase/2-methoxy-6-polyprenyl-1,4-benzoquinol methylase
VEEPSILLPNYYKTTYLRWYKYFSRIYDLFIRLLLFLLNGGFGGAKRWRQSIVDRVDPRPGEKIIDICCGTGTLTIMLAERLAGEGEVVGLELSGAQLRVAREKKRHQGLTFLEGDAQKLPFENGYFDKGIVCGALHEMPGVVRREVLSETHRVIRPGGRMVFVEQNSPQRKWKRTLFDLLERLNPEYPTYKDLMQSGLINEIEAGGFRVVRSEVVCWEFFQMVVAAKQENSDGGSRSSEAERI